MTKDDIQATLEGAESLPFILQINGRWTGPLRFVKYLDSAVKVLSNGLPAAFQYEQIDNISFDLSLSAAPAAPAVKTQDVTYWQEEAKAAVDALSFCIAPVDQTKALRSRMKASPYHHTWERVMNAFADAQKNHALEEKGDQLLAALADLPEGPELLITEGLVLASLGRHLEAADAFHLGGDHYHAACAASKAGRDDRALTELLCLIAAGDPFDAAVLTSLCYLLYTFKDGQDIVHVSKRIDPAALDEPCAEALYRGLLALLSRYSATLDDLDGVSGSKRELLPVLFKAIRHRARRRKPQVLPIGTLPSDTHRLPRPVQQPDVPDTPAAPGEQRYQGTIQFWKRTYGFIKWNRSTSLYLNIRQVEDDVLRDMLWNEIKPYPQVSFTLGVGMKGMAADCIRAVGTPKDSFEVKDGVLVSYGDYDANGHLFGRIQFDGRNYAFWDNCVIDPMLRAYLHDNMHIRETAVRFIGIQEHQKHRALKVWIDAEREPALIETYRPRVTEQQYETFLQKRDVLETQMLEPCTHPYRALPVWKGDVPAAAPRTPAPLPSVPKAAPDGSVADLLKKGTHYLTVVKDLEKAEACFKAVLAAHPPMEAVNTAALNLTMIYKQADRHEDARQILETYRRTIGEEKYRNQLIDILEKERQYEEEIALLKEMIPSAGRAASHRIKQLINCCLRMEDHAQALALLDQYRSKLDDLTYHNYQIQAREQGGSFEEAERYLTELIGSTYRTDHKLGYLMRLASLYQKNGDREKAIDTFQQWKRLFALDRSSITASTVIAALTRHETTVDRNLAILYHQSGRAEEAKQIAAGLLRRNSNDSVAQQILDDTYSSAGSETALSLEDTDGDAGFGYEDTDTTIPKLLDRMLSEVDLEKAFYGQRILNSLDETKRRYAGDAAQAAADLKDVVRKSLAGAKRSLAEQSQIYLALARISKQFADSGQKNAVPTPGKFYAQALICRADDEVKRSFLVRDSYRYHYFLALRFLSPPSRKSGPALSSPALVHAFLLLYRSFFLSDNEMADAVEQTRDAALDFTPPPYQETVLSVKELMTCSFELVIRYRYYYPGQVRRMIDAVYKHEKLRAAVLGWLSGFLRDTPPALPNKDAFFDYWRKAKDRYNEDLRGLERTLGGISRSIEAPEQLKEILTRIDRLDTGAFLCKTDDDHLRQMCRILRQFQESRELTMVDDREDALDKAIDLCESLERRILEAPTALSYEWMLDTVSMLKGRAGAMKNALYAESAPKLEVCPEPTAFYKEAEHKAAVTFYLENKGNVQKADISNIRLTGMGGNVEVASEADHPVTAVHGRGKEEYKVAVSFTEKEKERTLLDLRFSFDYSYHDGSGEVIKETFSDVFQVNLSNIAAFQKIENKYKAYTDSGAVTSDEMFFGRKKEIEQIVESLDIGAGSVLSHRGIYIYGQKRAGKSSIMAHLRKRIEEAYPGRYLIVDLGSVGENEQSADSIKSTLISKLETAIELYDPDIYDEIEKKCSFFQAAQTIASDPKSPMFNLMLEQIERALRPKNVVIMLFLDEFTYIYEHIKRGRCDDSFPHFWKALLQNRDICSIVIGQDSMKRFVEEYANDFACMKEMPVSYLDEESAKHLITDPILLDGKSRFDEDAVDLIYRLTAGSAYLIMIFCDRLVDYMNDRGTSRVTKITVESFVSKFLFSPSNAAALDDNYFDAQLVDPCFFANEDKIRQDNKTLLTYIAAHCNQNDRIRISDIDCISSLSVPTADHQRMLLDQLFLRKVLVREGEECYILVDLLRVYLKRGN